MKKHGRNIVLLYRFMIKLWSKQYYKKSYYYKNTIHFYYHFANLKKNVSKDTKFKKKKCLVKLTNMKHIAKTNIDPSRVNLFFYLKC